MNELLVVILTIMVILVFLIYLLKDEVFRKKGVVTVVKNLPLSIFKKSNKEEKIKEEIKVFTEMNSLKNEKKLNVNNNDNKIKNKDISELKNSELEKNSTEVEKSELTKKYEATKNDEEVIKEDFEIITEDIDSIDKDVKVREIEEEIVYWTPNGKTYHSKNTCRTLVRSKIINSGTVHESGKDFKCENCK